EEVPATAAVAVAGVVALHLHHAAHLRVAHRGDHPAGVGRRGGIGVAGGEAHRLAFPDVGHAPDRAIHFDPPAGIIVHVDPPDLIDVAGVVDADRAGVDRPGVD